MIIILEHDSKQPKDDSYKIASLLKRLIDKLSSGSVVINSLPTG